MPDLLKKLFDSADELNAKAKEFLLTAISKNNKTGFDYLEYKQSLAALKDMEMDELTAFKSAFATASTMGVTKDQLLNSAEFYKSVLSKEKTQFDDALQRQMKQKVENRRNERGKLEEQIKIYKQKIKQLQEEIDKQQKRIDNTESEIEEAKASLGETKNNFDSTYIALVNAIDSDMSNIKNYL
jgi:chromosome segregation ATPase